MALLFDLLCVGSGVNWEEMTSAFPDQKKNNHTLHVCTHTDTGRFVCPCIALPRALTEKETNLLQELVTQKAALAISMGGHNSHGGSAVANKLVREQVGHLVKH